MAWPAVVAEHRPPLVVDPADAAVLVHDAIPDGVRLALGDRRHDGAFDHRAAVGAGAAIPAQALFLEYQEATGAMVSPAPARPDVLARQACFRPVSEDGLSLIGAVPGIQGAYVATGHSV